MPDLPDSSALSPQSHCDQVQQASTALPPLPLQPGAPSQCPLNAVDDGELSGGSCREEGNVYPPSSLPHSSPPQQSNFDFDSDLEGSSLPSSSSVPTPSGSPSHGTSSNGSTQLPPTPPDSLHTTSNSQKEDTHYTHQSFVFDAGNDELLKIMARHRRIIEQRALDSLSAPPRPPPEETNITEPLPNEQEFVWEHHETEILETVSYVSVTASRDITTAQQASPDSPNGRRLRALEFLEGLLLSFLTQLQESVKQLEPDIHHRRSSSLLEDSPFGIALALANRKTGNSQELVFPETRSGSTPVLIQMSKLNRRIFFTASVLYECILNDGLVTKRDIYYRKVSLFGSQRMVDKIIDDVVCTAGLKRQDFCVCATSKGLISSNCLRIQLTTGEELCLTSSSCTPIPPEERIANIEADDLDWVLVVEKDAVMQALCGANLLSDERLGKGAIITGKGYPDLSTLQLLRRIADKFSHIPIYALVDADPHGIDILSVYTFGSQANRHSEDYAHLPLGDRLQWIGVKATELTSLGRYDDLLPLGKRDLQLAIAMCKNRPNMAPEWRRELCHMIHLNRKAEIQILCGADPNSDELENALLGAMGKSQSQSESVSNNRLVEYIVERVGTS